MTRAVRTLILIVIVSTVACTFLIVKLTADELRAIDREVMLREVTEIEDMTNDLYVEMLERTLDRNGNFKIPDYQTAHYYHKK